MGILADLLKKASQSVKDKYKIKIREKAIERVKEKLIKHNKKIEDYSDEEMEAMIAEEIGNLNEDVKKGVLTALLVAAGKEDGIILNKQFFSNNKIENLKSKETLYLIEKKIRGEMKSAVNKDKILSDEDAELLRKIFLKIYNEIQE